MAIHWQITFKTLRSNHTLTASVYDSAYSGNPIPLKAGAAPFETEENNDDDPFKAIRTQTGSLRIIDDGKDANGNTWNWRDLQPTSDYDRPVILRDENNTILWQGFLQPQNFSGTLYENVQEREFPLQCPLSILASQFPTTTDQGIVNFAFLLKYCADTVATVSSSVIQFTEFIIQGGGNAKVWLLKKFHWSNLLTDDDEENVSPQYDLFTCLEDMCNFWGWSARTEGTKLYLMCMEDPDEQRIVTMTPAQLATEAGGTAAGTENDSPFVRRALTGDIFASVDNDDMVMSGPNEAVVKADCNEQSTVETFAPPTVQKQMEDAGSYSWVAGTEENTGYYTTPLITSFDSNTLEGTAVVNAGGFCRRQYYSTPEQDNPTVLDMIVVNAWVPSSYTPIIQLRTKRMMSFSYGTLKIGGEVYKDNQEQWNDDDNPNNDFIVASIGIGETYQTAKWYYLGCSAIGNITHGWGDAHTKVYLTVNGSIKGTAIYQNEGAFNLDNAIDGMPVPATLHGYVFIDILGGLYNHVQYMEKFAIGDLKIEFSREQVYIPTSASQTFRPRTVKKDRVSTSSYKSLNQNALKSKKNIDLTYASDNNMKFGFGLVMNQDWSYMQYAEFHNYMHHPEQHFANRITNFWATSKRVLTTDLRTDVVEASAPITPLSHLVLDSAHFRTLAISHQWRDDVTNVKMIQSLIELNS